VFLSVTHSSRIDMCFRSLESCRQCLFDLLLWTYDCSAVLQLAVHQESELIEEMRFLKSYVCISRSLAVAVIVCYASQFKLESKSLEFARVHLNEFLEFARVELNESLRFARVKLNESRKICSHALAVSRYLYRLIMSCKSRRFHTSRSSDCVFVSLLLIKLDFSMFQTTSHSLLSSRSVAASSLSASEMKSRSFVPSLLCSRRSFTRSEFVKLKNVLSCN